MKRKPHLIAILIAVSCTGCMSMMQRSFNWNHAKLPYPGVRATVEGLARKPQPQPTEGHGNPEGQLLIGYPLVIADLPLSAAFDTLCLPYDLTHKDRR